MNGALSFSIIVGRGNADLSPLVGVMVGIIAERSSGRALECINASAWHNCLYQLRYTDTNVLFVLCEEGSGCIFCNRRIKMVEYLSASASASLLSASSPLLSFLCITFTF